MLMVSKESGEILMVSRPATWLIDSSIYIYKPWFTWSEDYKDKEGNQVQAVLGFMNFVHQLLNRNTIDYIAFAFDASQKTSLRREMYPAYKQNRTATPNSLRYQFQLCRRFIRLLGIVEAASPRYEADDLLGTWAKQQEHLGQQVYVITADKDLTQLVNPNILWWELLSEQQLDEKGVKNKFGVWPWQIADQLALAGDKVDNIPGVPEVGMATAAKLLRKFDSVESLLSSIDEIGKMQIRKSVYLQNVIDSHQDAIRLYQDITTIYCDVPDLEMELKRSKKDEQGLTELYEFLNVDDELRECWGV